MKKDESMKEIEQLLDMAPEIKDTRTKEEVFARLKKEGVFEERKQLEPISKQRKDSRWATMVVAVMGLMTFGSVGGYLLSQNSNLSMDEASSGTEMDAVTPEMSMERSVNPFSVEETGSYIPESTLAWEMELAQARQLSVGLVTEQLDVVPITVLIPNERVVQDLGSDVYDYLSYYKQYAAEIDEEALGFLPYHPLEGELLPGNGENGELIHQLPDNHPYDAGSAAEMLYTQVLNETFFMPYLQVQIVGEDGALAEFAHMGQVESIPLQQDWQDPYFAVEVAGARYLAPLRTTGVKMIDEALLSLQAPPDHPSFQSPILDGVSYTVELEREVAVITFTEPLQLANYELTDRVLMLDALIMTADNYGMAVQFENVVDVEGNSYPLGEPIERPLGANKIILP